MDGKGGKISFLPLHPTIAELSASMPRDGFWFPARKRNTGHIHSRSVSDQWPDADRSGDLWSVKEVTD